MARKYDELKWLAQATAQDLSADAEKWKGFDPYEYKDTVDNWELQVQNIADDIRNGNSADYNMTASPDLFIFRGII